MGDGDRMGLAEPDNSVPGPAQRGINTQDQVVSFARSRIEVLRRSLRGTFPTLHPLLELFELLGADSHDPTLVLL